MKGKGNIYTGIELGSDCIRIVVASFRSDDANGGVPTQDSELNVLGYSEVPSQKILKDEPTSPNIVAEQLSIAMQGALSMAGLTELSGVISVILSGAYIRQQIVRAQVQLDEHIAITETDYENAMKAINEEADKLPEVQTNSPFPLLCRGFHLADDRMVFNPVGQFSSRLTAESIFFFANEERYDPINALLAAALPNVQIKHAIYAPIAAACAILPPTHSDEPQSLVIDLGAGMTSLAIPTRIGFIVCEQLAIGTEHLSNDLSIALNISIYQARSIVNSLGSALPCTVVATRDGTARMVTIPSPNANTPNIDIPASTIEIILETRLTELFQLVKATLEKQKVYELVGNEIILTGVGATLPRITELAQKILNRSVKIGVPYKIAGCAPAPSMLPRYSMVLGLLRSAFIEEGITAIQHANSGFFEKIKDFWRAVVDC